MATKTKDEELEFRQGQKAEAEAQNQKSANAVPEQRPIASQTTDASHESATSQKLKDADDPRAMNAPPMDKEAYDRAREGAGQETGRTENLIEGQRIRVTKKGPDEGRNGHIFQVLFDDPTQEMVYRNGTQEGRRFAKISSYIIRTRDGRGPEQIELKPSEVKPLADIDFGRGEI